MIEKIKYIFLMLTLILCWQVPSYAQDSNSSDFNGVKGRVVIKGKTKDGMKESPDDEVGHNVYIFWNKQGANDALASYDKEKKSTGQRKFQAPAMVVSQDSGRFAYSSFTDKMVFVVIYNDIHKAIEVTEKNRKNLIFEFNDNDATWMKERFVDAKRKRKPAFKTGKTRAFGRDLVFNVEFDLNEDYVDENSRVIVSAQAVDCQDNDTVDYLQGWVGDGQKYQDLQVRKMAYDFQKNEPIFANPATRYNLLDTVTREDGMIKIKYSIPYKKRIDHHTYCCPGMIVAENLTDVYYKDLGLFGSCNEAEPFRFFQWDINGCKLDLTEEFYEPPSENLHDVPVNLMLQFERGKSILRETEQNKQEMERLVKELRRYGDQLVQIEVTGGASPDGSVAINKKLSLERAQVALNLLRKNIANFSHVNTHTDSHCFTWNDVADSLSVRGDTVKAARLRELASSSSNVFSVVKEDSVVGSILHNMISMRFVYKYQESKPLEPLEALAMYKSAGPDGYPYSSGDYYNILKQTEKSDPTLFKKVLQEAYKEKIKEPNYFMVTENHKFPLFLANRMACYSLDGPSPDTSIVVPFLAIEKAGVNEYQYYGMHGNKYLVNNPAMVAIMCSMALKLNMLDLAEGWANKLPEGSELKSQIDNFKKLVYVVLNWDNDALPSEKKEEGIDAAHELMKRSVVNNAVLKTELMKELEYKREEAREACAKVPDNDPRKWYMMAILTAPESERDEVIDDVSTTFNDFGTGFKPLSQEQQDSLSFEELNAYAEKEKAYKQSKEEFEKKLNIDASVKNTPAFLAYLQHSFDLNKDYRYYYMKEALIPEGVMKKWKYDPRLASLYRKKFDYLTKMSASSTVADVSDKKTN